MYVYIAVASLVVLVLKFLLTPDPDPVCGVYVKPGKWFTLKYYAFLLLLKLRQRRNAANAERAGYGVRSRNSAQEMDRAQSLPPSHPKAVDAVYFNGGNGEGCYFVGATARRHKNIVQTLLYIRFPDLGLLELTTLPDTSLQGTEEGTFAAGGLKFEAVKPMQTWNLTFDGNMRIVRTGEIKHVRFLLVWTATTDYFDFDTDMENHALAQAIARERWTRTFFDALKVAHQTHYEQFGRISGTVHIEGVGEKQLDVQGVRDHSYGNIRDWKDLHRYCIQYIQLEDGTAVCFGLICFPKTMSRLLIGYVFHPDGRKDMVSSTDFEFIKFGQDGHPPDVFNCRFTAAKKTYALRCEVVDQAHFFIGDGRDARIHERLCKFTVNGVTGWGISEWDYRHNAFHPDHFE
ncbi:uncharacterized protein LOC106180635 [Lingula anatina]|uniref:Uncharacterized protein LOC106180635 n=1 Tax=Lingula anatina TaxID=7574 RepID=A0A1S3KBW6_LINAN|nr:uncharacterized protein LOC106180635 [Lingula anatina]|eukprot:XP_013420120.1 uncharacterized protein LOC106180635 [Lingula anatina]